MMKPCDGTFAQNAVKHGVAGLDIDAGRVKQGKQPGLRSKGGFNDSVCFGNSEGVSNTDYSKGRFPANLIHDGSGEVLELFPDTGSSGSRARNNGKSNSNSLGDYNANKSFGFDDKGSAARFFYCAKASKRERNAGLDGMLETKRQNHHPTVKPIALMRYLVRLTATPTGGTVLDPFMGSGSTGIACKIEGRDFIGIELNQEYLEIAEKRIEHANATVATNKANEV